MTGVLIRKLNQVIAYIFSANKQYLYDTPVPPNHPCKVISKLCIYSVFPYVAILLDNHVKNLTLQIVVLEIIF